MKSPSKHHSVQFLEYLQANHYIAASGEEYAAEEVDAALWAKRQRKADRVEAVDFDVVDAMVQGVVSVHEAINRELIREQWARRLGVYV